MKRLIACILVFMICFTGCSTKSSELLMTFHGMDTGRNADIGTYENADAANFITSKVCAIAPEATHMQDENLPAHASIRIDITNNQMIFANNIYERIYPASTTKLLTALILLKYGTLSDFYTFKDDDAGITVFGAKVCGFKAGDKVSLETLLNCLLVYSGNDAGVGIAEYLSGSEEAFVEKMNEEAALIGATSTHFVNSHGLHNKEHYTTAYDMYLILLECLKYDIFKDIIKQAYYTAVYTDAEGETQRKLLETTNMFLLKTMETPEGVTVYGGKTGSTGEAGDCLILLSKDKDNTEYISAVFKASSKNELYKQLAYLLEMK